MAHSCVPKTCYNLSCQKRLENPTWGLWESHASEDIVPVRGGVQEPDI